jgi:hypothetical protein
VKTQGKKQSPQYLECKSIECIKIYIKHKIEFSGCDENDSNLLHKLAWLDLPEVFDFAYKNGCKWSKDSSHRTPYFLAKQGNCQNIINHFKENYPDLISNKIEHIESNSFVFERIFFLKQTPNNKDCFIALTKNANLVKYLKHGNELVVEQVQRRVVFGKL